MPDFEEAMQHGITAKVLEKWKRTEVFSFMLPGGISIHAIAPQWTKAVEIMIRMPPQPNQEGWCGNFNGFPSDESKYRGRLSAQESLFRPIVGPPKLMQTESSMTDVADEAISTASDPCEKASAKLREKAKAACHHLQEYEFHHSCLWDACMTGDIKEAKEAAEEMAVMMTATSMNGKCRCP